MLSLDRSVFRAAMFVVAGLCACAGGAGGEGHQCRLSGQEFSCDAGLVCNNTLGSTVCVRPMSLHLGDSCGSNAVCEAGLWCDFEQDPMGLFRGSCQYAGDAGSGG